MSSNQVFKYIRKCCKRKRTRQEQSDALVGVPKVKANTMKT